MKDYQTSLDKVSSTQTYIIKDYRAKVLEFKTIEEYLPKEITNLQELVDKSTPKNVSNAWEDGSLYGRIIGNCPICNGIVYQETGKYCKHCGQALKWK